MMKYFLVIILVLVGAGAFAYQQGMINKPEFGVIDRGDWGEINDTHAEIVTEIWVYNDNPIEASLNDITANYRLAMNRISIAHGKRTGLSIKEKNQSKKIRSFVRVQNLESWWVSHIRNDERSKLSVNAGINGEIGPLPLNINGISYADTVETDIEGMLNQAVGELKENYSYNAVLIQPEIQVRGGSARFGEVTDTETPIIFNIRLHNPNNYAIPKPRTAGKISMNDIKLAEWREEKTLAEEQDSKLIQSGETDTVTFRADLQNEKIGDWLITHANQEEKSNGEININMIFEIQGVELEIPGGNGISCRFDIQTAILEDNQTQASEFKGCSIPGETLGTRSQSNQNNDSESEKDDSENDNANQNTLNNDIAGLLG